MKSMRWLVLIAIFVSSVALVGCGVSKSKYESLLNEKIALEERAAVLTKANEALKNEYDSLLKGKMDLATKVETIGNEKNALKGEYDKILNEKVVLKAEYDKLLAGNVETQEKSAFAKTR